MFSATAERLLKHKRLIQVLSAGIVCADTARSFVVVTRLAQDRMQEIEEENRMEAFHASTDFMKRVVISRCAVRDRQFWPQAVSRAAGVEFSAAAHPTSAPPDAEYDALAHILRPMAPTLAEHTPLEHDLHAGLEEESFSAAAPQPGSHQQSMRSVSVVYITWDFVWGHVVQMLGHTVHMASAAVAERSEESVLVQEAAERRRRLEAAGAAALDAAREWCRGSMVWPELEVSRRSSLRYSVAWKGTTWPVRAAGSSDARKLVVDLAAHI